MLRPTLRVAAIAGLAAAGSAAEANAAAVALNTTCYLMAGSNSQPIQGAVSGVAAGQSISLRVSRKGAAGGTSPAVVADGAGNLTASIDTWFVPLGSGPKREVEGLVEAIDVATGTAVASAPASLANLDYSVKRASGRLFTWKVQGLGALSGSKTYYAHYLNNGKYKGRQKLGTGTGNCGYLNVKKPLTPFRKIGRYDVTIQASEKLNPDLPGIKGRVVVTKKYR